MSNKAVVGLSLLSQGFKHLDGSVIDKVISNVRPDFEENGIEEEILVALQERWEAKLAGSRVTDFSSDLRLGAFQRMYPMPDSTAGPSQQQPNGSSSAAKNESKDVKPEPLGSTMIDPSTSSTSQPQASTSASTSTAPSKANADSNELGSDLDEPEDNDLLSDEDGDDEDADGAGPGFGDGDVVVALYEKVHRVKNKWKITLRDGVVSAQGKDYIFNKCQGDFEW